MTDAPLDGSIVDILEQSPLDAIPGNSVDEVLRTLGLPPLPAFHGPVAVTGHPTGTVPQQQPGGHPPVQTQPGAHFAGSGHSHGFPAQTVAVQQPAALPDHPLPPLPALPGLDLPTLLEPLTDAVRAFGTGAAPGSGTSADPIHLLTRTGTVLQGAQQLGVGALRTLSTQWTGQGAGAAQTKGEQAAHDNSRIQSQGKQQQGLFTQAAAVVADGKQQIHQVVTQLHQRLAQLSGSRHTVAGQAAVLAATNEANARAAQIVARTRSQLSPLTAHMHEAGRPVPVSSAPRDLSHNPWLNSLLSTGKPDGKEHGKGGAKTTSSGGGQGHGGGHGGHPLPAPGAGVLGPTGGLVNGIAMPPLSPWATTRFADWKPAGSGTGGSSTKDGSKDNGAPPMSPLEEPQLPLSSSMMPLRAAATAAGMGPGVTPGGFAGAPVAWRENLITAAHGDQLIGDLDQGSFAVVGGVEQLAVPSARKKKESDDEDD